jgi:hypothetical protein
MRIFGSAILRSPLSPTHFCVGYQCFCEVIYEKRDSKLAKRKHQFQKTMKLPF